MSMNSNRTVEERVVEMRIDNSKFESGANKTIGILERLDKALHLHTETDEIDKLTKAVGKFDASPMTSGLDSIQRHFSALEIAGMRVISNLTDSVYNFTTKTIKDLTIDQVAQGWDKYAEKTSAVQTIMAATRKDIGTLYADEADQMAAVNEQMEKLNWFTDETSYSFLDMVNNIGKFTSNGRALEESVTAMMGISTWAAISGANVTEAGRAMYNLSQALGTGSVQVRDWMSIENANMATYEFKQMAIETAEALGTLKKRSDGVWESLEGNEVTIESFRENLKDKWFTSDVLLETLQYYGKFTEALKKATDATDTTATEFLRAMEKYESGEAVDSELIPWIERLSVAEYDLGRRAFQAAQEAKTFKEAIDATKDAVSTGWMNTFEIIFGDYKTAKGFWTDVANDLWEIFASGGESRNSFLEVAFGDVNEQINRGELFRQSLLNLLELIITIKSTIGTAFENVFGTSEERGEMFGHLIEQFHAFTENIGFSEDALLGVQKVLEILFSSLKIFIKFAGTAFSVLWKVLQPFANMIDDIFAMIGRSEFNLDELIKSVQYRFEEFKPVVESLDNVITFLFDSITQLIGLVGGGLYWAFIQASNAIGPFGDIVQFLANKLESLIRVLQRFGNYIREGYKRNGFLGALETFFTGLRIEVRTTFPNLSKWLTAIGDFFKNNKKTVLDFFKNFEIFESLPDIFQTGLTGIGSIFSVIFGGILTLITGIINGLTGLNFNVTKIKDTFQKFSDIIQFIFTGVFGDPKEIKERVTTFVSEIWNGFIESVEKISLRDMIKALRLSVFLVLAAKIAGVLSTFKKVTEQAATIPEALSGAITRGGKVFDKIGQSFQANAIIKMAVAVGMVAMALYGLSKIDPDKLTHAASVISVVMLVLTLLVKSIRRANKYTNIDIKRFTLFDDLAGILIGLGIVVASFASAIYKIASIEDPDKLKIAASIVAGILLAVIGTVWALSRVFGKTDSGRTKAIGSTMLKIGGSIMLISLAIGSLTLPIITLMGVTAFLLKKGVNMDDLADSLNSFIYIIGLIFIFIFAITAIMSFGKMNVERLHALGTNILKIGSAIALIAFSMQMLILPLITLTAVIAALENVKFGKEGKTLGLESLNEALKVMGKIAVALLGVALILSLISLIPFKPGKLIAIAAAITILSVGMLILAPAMILLTAALAGFAYVLKDIEGFEKGLSRLKDLAGTLFIFSAAAMLFGIGVAAMGIGLVGASLSLALFSGGIFLLVLAIDKVMDISDKFIDFIKKIWSYMTWDNAKKIGLIIVAVVALTAAIALAGRTIGWFIKLLSGGFKLGNFFKTTAESLGHALPGFFKSLSTKVLGFMSSHTKEILAFLNGAIVIIGLYLLGVIPTLTDTIVQAITTLLSSVADSIEAHKNELRDSIVKIVTSILDLVQEVITELWGNTSIFEKILLGAGVAIPLLKLVKSIKGAVGVAGKVAATEATKVTAEAAAEAATAAKGASTIGIGSIVAIEAATVGAGMAARNASDKSRASELLGNVIDDKQIKESKTKIEAYIATINELKTARTLLTNVNDEDMDEQDMDRALRTNAKAVEIAYKDLAKELRITSNELKKYEATAIQSGGSLSTVVEELTSKTEAFNEVNNTSADAVDKIQNAYADMLTVIEAIPDNAEEPVSKVSASIDEMKSKLKELDVQGFAAKLGIKLDVDNLSDAEITELFNKLSQKIGTSLDESTFGSSLSEKIMGIFDNGIPDGETLKAKYADVGKWIPEGTGQGIMDYLGSFLNANEEMGTQGLSAFSEIDGISSPSTAYAELTKWIPEGAALGILNNLTPALNAIVTMIKYMHQPFQNIQNKFQNHGVQVVRGIVIGINGNLNAAYNAGVNLANAVNRGFTATLKIHSPSRVFEYLAGFIPEAVGIGIDKNKESAIQSIVVLSDAMIQAAEEAMQRVSYVASENYNYSPTITPVLDLDRAFNDYNRFNGLFGNSPVPVDVKASGRLTNPVFPNSSINYEIANQNKDVVEEIQHLNEMMGRLGKKITEMQIILDTGVLVGQLSPGINSELGIMAMREGRQ